MSKRTTSLRPSAIRIAMALAVAGVGLSFVAATPTPTPVPTITVEAQVDDPFPSSGDAVTLTASADGPTGSTYTYQWQRKSGVSWANISGAMSATLSQTYSTRGTRIYRVRATSGAMTATSDALYLTWDEATIVNEMLRALARKVTAASAYSTAETALLNCVQLRTGTRPSSFNDVLSKYTGATKTAVDACETSGAPCSGSSPALSATTMFATYQSLARTKLAELRRENTEYNTLLSSSEGERFASSVGSVAMTKQAAALLSVGVASQAQREASRPVSGQTTEVVSSIDLCIDSRRSKYVVLNCLVFETAYNDWIKLSESESKLSLYKQAISNYNGTSANGLGTGDDVCTDDYGTRFGIDGHHYSCLKHDLAYDSLQRFIGGDTSTKNSDVDAAWNPRNQHLANVQFFIDQVCGRLEATEIRHCIEKAAAEAQSPPQSYGALVLTSLTERQLNRARYDLVRIHTTKGPVTQQDYDHITRNPRFMSCTIPHVGNFSLRQDATNKRRFTASWELTSSCTGGTAEIYFVSLTNGAGERVVKLGNSSPSTFSYLFVPGFVTGFSLNRVRIEPNGYIYGPRHYEQSVTSQSFLWE